ncbi:MAG: undecaprenyldiphospho-muramoylpentapeptide beta-N-acetylglucosaminyltransferase [Verrucomicrobia bacterium]|nr:undecaprenyldiphospho-muramoylpentapeptide beta-N-acetylglucosaminyltransferase [Verrucomicrobiota bacterium]
MSAAPSNPLVAIACGGTGGHLFPGLAVAEALLERGCDVTLLVSPKDVDQHAVRAIEGCEVVTLPAVALQGRRVGAFLRGGLQSYCAAKKMFRARTPRAVLAMGGFTSAPPILAARSFGAATFLHEANTIPGRANRWLASWVDEVFVGFQSAVARLRNQDATVTGTPVRPQFQPADPASCRTMLRLAPERPVLLVMGGSQGASAINDALIHMLDELAARAPQLQFLHLTGANDIAKVREAYAARKLKAVVQPFLTEMDLALGAATVAISRAGASSLAEFAAMRVPAILVPYPSAADNHQFYNARAFIESGAARLWEQDASRAGELARMTLELLENASAREVMQQSLARWHTPQAAEQIATSILRRIGAPQPARALSDDAGDGAFPLSACFKDGAAGRARPSPSSSSSIHERVSENLDRGRGVKGTSSKALSSIHSVEMNPHPGPLPSDGRGGTAVGAGALHQSVTVRHTRSSTPSPHSDGERAEVRGAFP